MWKEIGEIYFSNIYYLTQYNWNISTWISTLKLVSYFTYFFILVLSLWNPGVFYTCHTSEFELTTLQVLSSDRFLVATILEWI